MGIFFPYQVKWVQDKSKLKIKNKSRQIGHSETVGYEAVMETVFGDGNTPPVNNLLMSSSMRQSKNLMLSVEKYIEIIGMEYGKPIKLKIDNQEQKTFSNNKSIFCLPANERTARGFNGNVKLDEFALMRRQREIYRALYPAITKGYRISIGSTPLGMNDLFYELFSNVKLYPSFSRHQTSIVDAVAQGLKVDINELRLGIDPDSFDQEFMCMFIDDHGSFFPLEIINIGDYDISLLPVDDDTFMGVDIGRTKDLTVISVIKKVKGKFYLIFMEVFKNKPFREQRDKILELFQLFNCVRCRIDSTGIGMQLSEELHKLNPLIEGVHFTNEIKHTLVTTVKKHFSDRTLEIYDDRDLIVAIHSIKRTISPSNNMIFQSERDNVRGHADHFWSLALALNAGVKRKPMTATWDQS